MDRRLASCQLTATTLLAGVSRVTGAAGAHTASFARHAASLESPWWAVGAVVCRPLVAFAAQVAVVSPQDVMIPVVVT